MGDKPLFKLALLAFMGLIIATPLFKPAMLCGDDFQGHLSMAIELDRAWSQGVIYPRWSPDIVFGYGMPTFNFYPPLPRVLGVAMHWLLGLPLREAVELPMALALMLAGPAMYLLARSVYGERAGLIAGLAYTFAPYLADDTLQRFALNEALAMALAPLVLWAFGRLNTPSPRIPWGRVVLAAAAFAALIVAHTLMTLLYTPLLAVYLLIVWRVNGWPGALIARAALAGVAAMGLTAFFWLPFLAESRYVQMWRAPIWEATGELLYPLHFYTLQSIVVPQMLWPDYSVGNPILQRMLALPQIVLAGGALVVARRSHSRLVRAVTVLFGATLVLSVFLITSASRPLWDRVSILHIVQFPWRFLAHGSLAAALLTGAAFSNLRPPVSYAKGTMVLLDAVLFLVLMAWTLPWLRPFTCNIEANPSNAFLIWADRKTEAGGSTGEHLPRWVQTPPTESPLEADLLAGKVVDRLDRASLPEGAQAQLQSVRWLESRWQVTSPHAFTASFYNFYYPGWSVRVDDTPVPIWPAPSSGLLQAQMPVGQYVVTLRLDSTPPQTMGNLVSLGTLLGLIVLFVVTSRKEGLLGRAAIQNNTAAAVPGWEWLSFAVIGLITLVARLALATIAPPAVPLGPHIPPHVTRVSVDLGEQVQLVGYEFSTPRIEPGQTMTVTLYWETKSLLMSSYKTFVHVVDAQGQLVAQSDTVPRNWTYATTGWLPGEWIGDPHRLDIPANVTRPLEVWAGMYEPETGQRLKPPGDPSGRIKLGTLNLFAR